MLALTGCSAGTPTPVISPTHIDLTESWPDDVGNGVTLLGTADARGAVLTAMRQAGTSTMEGTLIDGQGATLSFRVSGRAGAAEARFEGDGQTTLLSVIDGVAYLLPSERTAAASGLASDAYACLGVDDPLVQGWMPLMDPTRAVARYTADAGAIADAGKGTANLLLGAEGTVGALTIATDGAPLPSRLVRADELGTLELRLDGWGVTERPTAPEPLGEGC